MKTIIFDFDGTIADSFELALEIAYELTGVKRISEAEVARLRQLPVAKVIRELHVPLTRLPKLILQGRQKMHGRIGEVRPFPGMQAVLRSLHKSGYHLLVMSSNSEQNVRAFLRSNDMELFFDGVYGGVAVFNKTGALRKILKRNRIDVKTCYYVGDEVRDIVAASKAGVEPVAVAWGYQAPNALSEYHPLAVVKRPAGLLDIFGDDKV